MLAQLLAHPNAHTFDITVLVRSPEKAGKLKTFGVTPVLGSLEDLDLLEELASKAHVVFSCVRSPLSANILLEVNVYSLLGQLRRPSVSQCNLEGDAKEAHIRG